MIPTSVSSGREALEKIAGQQFDVALIDYQMPEMDGLSLAKTIREQSSIPLILLSSAGRLQRRISNSFRKPDFQTSKADAFF